MIEPTFGYDAEKGVFYMATERMTLDSVLPEDLKRAGYGDLKSLFGKVITLHDVSFTKRNDAWRAMFTITLQGDTKKQFVTTGGMQPLKIGKYLMQNKLFPIDAKFITEGQAVMLVDPDKPWTPEAPEELPF